MEDRTTTRRKIRIGEQVVSAIVCELCPQRPAIWPASAFAAHVVRHNHADEVSQSLYVAPPEVRYRGGRGTGTRNRRQMSSTGVIKRKAIRHSR